MRSVRRARALVGIMATAGLMGGVMALPRLVLTPAPPPAPTLGGVVRLDLSYTPEHAAYDARPLRRAITNPAVLRAFARAFARLTPEYWPGKDTLPTGSCSLNTEKATLRFATRTGARQTYDVSSACDRVSTNRYTYNGSGAVLAVTAGAVRQPAQWVATTPHTPSPASV